MQCSGFVFQRWAGLFKYCVFTLFSETQGNNCIVFPSGRAAVVRLHIPPARLTLGTGLGWRAAGWDPAQLWLRWPLVSFMGCQWLRGVEDFRCWGVEDCRCWGVCANVPARGMYVCCWPPFLLHCTGFFPLAFFSSFLFPDCKDF